eukprot:TRINITY_DN81903_c0_g1_i1.p1 TRINITY_DN81903_c0_g1~~TRINITY_DN81903_c0_g1_i1.p1  ORF type:complete len:265 (-),score=33.98 TRINITY_DN81903_c0_g1_i1:38-832(-)
MSQSDATDCPDRRLVDFDIAEAARDRAERPHRRPLRLLLIRHGQSAMNVTSNLIGGRSNSAPLTQKGEEQAEKLGCRLHNSGISFDKVFCSPAVRARETARIACKSMGVDPAVVKEVPDVLEICQGEWTGKERSVVYDAAFLERVENEKCFLRAPGVSEEDALEGGPAPPGESQWDVECRVADFINSLLKVDDIGSASQETVAVFMHGIAIKCFLRRVLGANALFAVHCGCENTSISELVYKTGDHNLDGWHIVRINDFSHLDD